MNSCILIAKIVRSPELRYTQDTQTPISQMLVEFEGLRPEDPPATLKVVGWGNLATEIQEKYTEGNQVIIEGRLSMNMIDRPEGFKEKRAELVVSRIHLLETNISYSAVAAPPPSPNVSNNVVSMDSYKSPGQDLDRTNRQVTPKSPMNETPSTPIQSVSNSGDGNLDDIPFVRSVDSKTVEIGLLDLYEINVQCPQVGVNYNFKFIYEN